MALSTDRLLRVEVQVSVGAEFERSPRLLPPEDLIAVVVDGALRLVWKKVHGEGIVYAVYPIAQSGDEPGEPMIVGLTRRTYFVAPLNNGQTYYFRVRAFSTSMRDEITGELLSSTYSNEAAGTPEIGYADPGDPDDDLPGPSLSVTSGDQELTPEWSALPNYYGLVYRLYESSESGKRGYLYWEGTDLSQVMTGLTNRQAYYLTVLGHLSYKDTLPSIQVAGIPVLAPPTNLQAVPGNRSAELTWDASPAVGITYSIFAKAGALPEILAASEVTDLFYTVTGLYNGVPTTFRVVAVRTSADYSDSSNVATATPGLQALNFSVAPGNTSLTLTWSGGVGDGTIVIRRGLTPGNLDTIVYYTVNAPGSADFVDEGLANGTTYYYSIQETIPGSGSSPYSYASGVPEEMSSGLVWTGEDYIFGAGQIFFSPDYLEVTNSQPNVLSSSQALGTNYPQFTGLKYVEVVCNTSLLGPQTDTRIRLSNTEEPGSMDFGVVWAGPGPMFPKVRYYINGGSEVIDEFAPSPVIPFTVLIGWLVDFPSKKVWLRYGGLWLDKTSGSLVSNRDDAEPCIFNMLQAIGFNLSTQVDGYSAASSTFTLRSAAEADIPPGAAYWGPDVAPERTIQWIGEDPDVTEYGSVDFEDGDQTARLKITTSEPVPPKSRAKVIGTTRPQVDPKTGLRYLEATITPISGLTGPQLAMVYLGDPGSPDYFNPQFGFAFNADGVGGIYLTANFPDVFVQIPSITAEEGVLCRLGFLVNFDTQVLYLRFNGQWWNATTGELVTGNFTDVDGFAVASMPYSLNLLTLLSGYLPSEVVCTVLNPADADIPPGTIYWTIKEPVIPV